MSAIWCLPSDFSFWIHLWFLSAKGPGVGCPNFCQHHLYHLHLPLEGVSVVIRMVGPLGFLWENCGCVTSAPALPALVCTS